MKPIPKELRAYFPDRWCPDRPWWKASWQDDVNDFMFKRPDGYGTALLSDREEIDRAHPMQPPPILVGQVWAIPTTAPGSFFIASLIAVELRSDGRRALHWSGYTPSHPQLDTYTHGFLLSCPFGYAPWSGSEVT